MKHLTTLCICVCLVVATTGTAAATDWYVSSQGDDEAAGTRDAPWKTVRRAVRRDSGVLPGDTINLTAGIYRERVSVEIGGRGTSWDNAELLKIRAAPGDEGRVVFKGIQPIDFSWRKWKGNVYYAEGVTWRDCRFLLQGLDAEDVPPDDPPPAGAQVDLAPGEALVYVPLNCHESS